MAEHDFDRALRLEPGGPGIWNATADPNYESINGMFGGWTTAVALRAVSESAAGGAKPSAMTVNFITRIDPGTGLIIRTRRAGGGRSVSHWGAELLSKDDRNSTLATASVVLAKRRPSDEHVDLDVPTGPDPETLEPVYPAPGTAGERCEMRPIEGYPPFSRTTTYSTAWVKETSCRAIDPVQLAFLSDFRPPRSFYWSDGPRASATLSASVYFHATDEELEEVGDDFLLSEAFGTRGAQSTSEEHLRLWSRGGALLSSSVQMAWYY
jgi:acyl-CoA thioesterase